MSRFEYRVRLGQRGAALPLAAMTLTLLASLLVGLSVMSATEPTIASNQLRTAQAHALADAGIERALWALRHPEAPEGLSDPLPEVIPPPYDGSRFIELVSDGVRPGGFRLTILPGASPNERQLLSVGWAPTDATADPRLKAHRRVAATLWRLPSPARTAPCALCVLGNVDLADAAAVDASADPRCGGKMGAWSSGIVSVAPSARLSGAEAPGGAASYRQGQPTEAALGWILTPGDLLALKRIARARGTYYRGTVVFDTSRPAPEGLVFVDTRSGAPLTAATPADEAARVDLRGGAFRGWLVVEGALEISGDARMRGLAYARDGFGYHGSAPGGMEGQVVAVGVRGGSASLARTGEGTALTFDCAAAIDGDGTVPSGWMLKTGSYRDLPDP